MTSQLAHERNGILLSRASSIECDDRARILQALQDSHADLSKAQTCGHCNQLTARLTETLLHHLLFAKGQLPAPISLLQRRREAEFRTNQASRPDRPRTNATRTRKEDRLFRKLDQLRLHLEQAASQLAMLVDNNGEGPSKQTCASQAHRLTSNDLRLLVVMGSSAAMPREVFVLDLIQAVGRSNTIEDALRQLDNSPTGSFEPPDARKVENTKFAQALPEVSERTRDAARTKTSSNWERKLVRLLVSDERLEPFLGTTLAPTKLHLFLSAPTSFRCPGWSARQHLDFDLDCLYEKVPADDMDVTPASADTSMSSSNPQSIQRPKRAPSSPLYGQERRWSKSMCESGSSVADSWPEDSASDQLAESSISSVSDDSRPSSAAEKCWHMSIAASAADGWLPRCGSPLAIGPNCQMHEAHSVEASRTGSSLGSSTVYGHDSHETATGSLQDSPHHSEDAAATRNSQVGHMCKTAAPVSETISRLDVDGNAAVPSHQIGAGVRRRSREPKAGGLLSRNLLKGKGSRQHTSAGSDLSSVRSAASFNKRAPRCAGLQINFTDPDQPAASLNKAMNDADSNLTQPVEERCWFQCEAVLEGFR